MARRENKEIEDGVGSTSTEAADPRGSGSASVADWRWETAEGCGSTSQTSWKRPLAPAGLHVGESKTAAGGGSAPWPAAAQLKVAYCAGAARCAGVGAWGFGPGLNKAGGTATVWRARQGRRPAVVPPASPRRLCLAGPRWALAGQRLRRGAGWRERADRVGPTGSTR
jgi:hypothetical protein